MQVVWPLPHYLKKKKKKNEGVAELPPMAMRVIRPPLIWPKGVAHVLPFFKKKNKIKIKSNL
jgi:hypothetical protein